MHRVDELHMLDGRRYFTTDGWQTIRILKPGGGYNKVAGEEADLVRFLAIVQSGSTRNENVETGK